MTCDDRPPMTRIAKRYHYRCCACGGERDRPGQRYCRACHNAANREWRAKRMQELRDLRTFRAERVARETIEAQ